MSPFQSLSGKLLSKKGRRCVPDLTGKNRPIPVFGFFRMLPTQDDELLAIDGVLVVQLIHGKPYDYEL